MQSHAGMPPLTALPVIPAVTSGQARGLKEKHNAETAKETGRGQCPLTALFPPPERLRPALGAELDLAALLEEGREFRAGPLHARLRS